MEEANILQFSPLGGQRVVIDRASHGTRFKGHMPPGHAQGFVEALSQLYDDMAGQLEAHLSGVPVLADALLLPGIEDGVRGMRFIDARLRSGAGDGEWAVL